MRFVGHIPAAEYRKVTPAKKTTTNVSMTCLQMIATIAWANWTEKETEILGEDHPDTLTTKNSLTATYNALKEKNE